MDDEHSLGDVPQKLKELFNKGFAALERGNLDYAIDLLFACVEADPMFLQARKFLRAAEIQRCRKRKKDRLPDSLITLLNLPTYLRTLTLMKGDKPDEALLSAEKLFMNAPLSPKFIKLFAEIAVAAENPAAAVQTLETARDYHPNDVTIINWLGTLYLKVGRTRAARECFERLCEICPNDPAALKSLKDAMALDSMAGDGWSQAAEGGGSFRQLMKDSDEAVLLEQDAKSVKSDKDLASLIADNLAKIKDEPENINFYRALARLYAQKGDYVDAMATLEKAREISPADPEIDRAVTDTRLAQFDADIRRLQDAGDTEGANAEAEAKNRFIFEDLQDRMSRYPNDLRLRFEWGVVLYENERMNEAIQQFQLSQRSPKHRIRSLYYMAMCFKAKRQYDMASDQLKRAASEVMTMDVNKKDIYYELGQMAELSGNPEEAIGFYKDIYQVDIGYRDVAAKIEQAYGQNS